MSGIRLFRFALVSLVAAAALLVPTVASAYTLPNLVALASPDMQVAVTYAGYAQSPQVMADAGAFASTMTQQFGMVGIPNYDPTTQFDSYLICSATMDPVELIAVYGLRGYGVQEGIGVCSAMENNGVYIQWSPQAFAGL